MKRNHAFYEMTESWDRRYWTIVLALSFLTMRKLYALNNWSSLFDAYLANR